MMNNIKTFVSTLLFISIVLLLGCSDGQGEKGFVDNLEDNANQQLIHVRVQRVAPTQPHTRVALNAITRAKEESRMSFQASGRVTFKNVKLGQSVSKGQVLISLVNPVAKSNVLAAQQTLNSVVAQRKQAEADELRYRTLLQADAVSQREYDSVNTRYVSLYAQERSAKAALARAKSVLAETDIISPYDSTVTDIFVDVGDVVTAGQPVVSIADISSVNIEPTVAIGVANMLAIGDQVVVRQLLRNQERSVVGVISEITPFSQRGTLPKLSISLEPQSLPPGEPVQVELKLAQSSGVIVPIRAIVRNGSDLVAVYKIVEGRAQVAPVKIVNIDSEFATVDGDIGAGDTIVVDGVSKVFHGAKVEVMP